MENKNTPRDFIMHVATFGVLYFIVIAFITLVFTLIDVTFLDTLLGGYSADTYSGSVRFAIATLVILTPLFVYLMKRIQNDARRDPLRTNLPVRRWLTYITLFIAGATVATDLIVLLYSFLGGALPTPFALKSLVILAVAGVTFWYFIKDLHGFWTTRKVEGTYMSYGFVGTIIASLVLGFMALGSPTTQRELRMDEERIMHLSTIQSQIVNYWQQNNTLPKELSLLNNDIYGMRIPLDPETNTEYAYTVTGDTSFELCTDFTRPSSERIEGEYYPSYGFSGDTSWKHGSGPTCFARTIDTNLIKPFMVPSGATAQPKTIEIN
jgi:hypothetical protein